jgi:hypothetical protein
MGGRPAGVVAADHLAVGLCWLHSDAFGRCRGTALSVSVRPPKKTYERRDPRTVEKEPRYPRHRSSGGVSPSIWLAGTRPRRVGGRGST